MYSILLPIRSELKYTGVLYWKVWEYSVRADYTLWMIILHNPESLLIQVPDADHVHVYSIVQSRKCVNGSPSYVDCTLIQVRHHTLPE